MVLAYTSPYPTITPLIHEWTAYLPVVIVRMTHHIAFQYELNSISTSGSLFNGLLSVNNIIQMMFILFNKNREKKKELKVPFTDSQHVSKYYYTETHQRRNDFKWRNLH